MRPHVLASSCSRLASSSRASTSAREASPSRAFRASHQPRVSRARATRVDGGGDETFIERYEDVFRASPAAFGGACGVALLANRALSGVAPVADASSAQSRADVICLAMAACLILTGFTWVALKTKPPNVVDLVGARLDEPYVSPAASADAREELLWAWDAARAATNCDVMAVFTKDGERIMQAGVAANELADPSALSRRVELGPIVSAAASRGAPNNLANLILFPGRVEFEQFFPVNTQAVCVRPIGDGAALVIGSRVQRGLTPNDQRWFEVVAQKLDRALDRS
jgi:hypothetical protein